MRGVTCPAGQLITLGCGACNPSGPCEGDPVLRVCEGTEACASFESLGLAEGTCSQCVQTQFFCPPSGVYSVLSGGFDSSQPAMCQPTVQTQGPFGLLDACPLVGPQRDCGWTVSPTFNAIGCVPGQQTTLACGDACGGTLGGACTGDPMMRVCAGSQPCTAATALVTNDDACGSLCSSASFTCPSDGVYTVMTGGFGNQAFTCEPASAPPPPVVVPPPPVEPPLPASDAGAP
jgi:hypothetical protein